MDMNLNKLREIVKAREAWHVAVHGAAKNRCFQIVVLEKTLEGPLDYKEIKPIILKEINPEYSLEGLLLKLKLLILWTLM